MLVVLQFVEIIASIIDRLLESCKGDVAEEIGDAFGYAIAEGAGLLGVSS